jgi:hypothetical protein
MKRIAVYVEVAPKRTFAGAIEWPGWARSGRTEADALEALLAYAPRYARLLGAQGGFVQPTGASGFEIVERLPGSATTEFGAPGEIPEADGRPLDSAELERQLALMKAAWSALDRAATGARGATLRKGPRGGGRPLPRILEHVMGAEAGYLAKLGERYRGPADDMAGIREAETAAVTAAARYEPMPNPNAVRRRWSPRYFIRRAAWHILDHAWEIEDRARAAGP